MVLLLKLKYSWKTESETCFCDSYEGVVYSLRAVQANQLRRVRPHHGERLCLQSLCHQPGGPQRGALHHTRQRLHPENRWLHMYKQSTSNFMSWRRNTQLSVCLLRYRVQAALLQGTRLLGGSQVHTSVGEPFYHSRIQHDPQLLRQRHPEGQQGRNITYKESITELITPRNKNHINAVCG